VTKEHTLIRQQGGDSISYSVTDSVTEGHFKINNNTDVIIFSQ